MRVVVCGVGPGFRVGSMTAVRGWWEACVWWLRRCGFMGRKYVVERTAVMTDIKDSSGSRRLLARPLAMGHV